MEADEVLEVEVEEEEEAEEAEEAVEMVEAGEAEEMEEEDEVAAAAEVSAMFSRGITSSPTPRCSWRGRFEVVGLKAELGAGRFSCLIFGPLLFWSMRIGG